jgi:hypothetical protein
VLISSCDAFSDLWPICFHFFFRFFPDAPIPVFLVANFDEFKDFRVRSLKTGRDRHWGTNLRHALRAMEAPYILYLQDDYLINGHVDRTEIDGLVSLLHAENGTFISLQQHPLPGKHLSHNHLVRLTSDTFRYVNLQAGIWNRERLLGMVVKGHNPWQGEVHFKNQLRQHPEGYFCHTMESREVFPYLEAVKGGFWMRQAVDYCLQNGIKPDLFTRPCPPWGDEWYRKLYRSWLKRRQEFNRIIRAMKAPIAGERIVIPLAENNPHIED